MPDHRVVAVALAIVLATGVGVASYDELSHPAAPEASVLMAWTSQGLPEGFDARVEELEDVVDMSLVRGDLVDLVGSWDAEGNPVDRLSAGMAIPLDALAVEPASYAAILGEAEADAVAGLAKGQALLGERSARLRGLGRGATLELGDGRRVTVAGVVDDDLVGHAELVVSAPSQTVPTERFVLLTHVGARDEVEAAIRAAARGRSVQVRASDELADLRPGGSLLPQVALKERFGEFSYRPTQGRSVAQDDGWVDRHIRVTRVPILGEVACHREVVGALQGAMAELAAEGLAHTVDPSQYAGCFGPRLIRPGAALSRHAWGIAVDLNSVDNPYGAPSAQDPRLVATMARWGFRWGGEWLVPDPMHFEYVGDFGPERSSSRRR